MKKERVWLQECQEAYNNLFHICEEIDEEKIKNIFPIFKTMSITPGFVYQWNNPYIVSEAPINDKVLYLCIQFPSRNKKEVEEWLFNSIYNSFTIGKVNFNTYVVEFVVNDIITDILNHEIRELHNQCEEVAKPFYENKENQLLSDYEEQCLEEDEYYLGVRFINYSGAFPTYCDGVISLEIEGIPYDFNLLELQGSKSLEFNIGAIKPESFDINIRRYYNEIMRVIRKNLYCTCCGGCE